MRERRKSKRRNLSYYMVVIDSATQEMIGHLIDITLHGLQMDSQKPFPLEQDYHLRLDVTPDVANKSFIEFIARSKWSRPDTIEPNLYDTGFEIIKISQDNSQIIQRIVDKYGSRDSSPLKL